MSKHWRPPVRVMFQGNVHAGKDKNTPAREGLAGHRANKSTAEPTHSLFRDDVGAPVFSGTMEECYRDLARRMPGGCFDYLLCHGGWTIKGIDEPKRDETGTLILLTPEGIHELKPGKVPVNLSPEPDPDVRLVICLKCFGQGCKECHRGMVEVRVTKKGCCGACEAGSSTDGPAKGLPGPAGETSL